MIKNIKETLKESNRYDDVLYILNKISLDNAESYPVDAFNDGCGRISYKVDGLLLRKETKLFIELINGEPVTIAKNPIDSFKNLLRYISSTSDMLLHNYSIRIAHRRVPNVDMEKIRSYLIIQNLLHCLEFDNWDIPGGWKKINQKE